MNKTVTKSVRQDGYTDKLANTICEAIANSSYGLRRLCADNPEWPDRSTIMRWLVKYPAFVTKYQAAKEGQADYLVDEMVEIADNQEGDVKFNKKGEPYLDVEFVRRSELRVNTREKSARMLAPRKYGTASEMKIAELERKLEAAINDR